MNIKQNLKNWPLFFRSKIGIFEIFFKRLCKESFEDLEFNSNWKFQTRAALWPLKFFANLHKSPLLIASIVKGAVSGLRQFLATESPWKIMKNAFYFILTNLLLGNQILLILCILIKPNVWYLWSLKILAIKRWFPFNFAKILQDRHFVVGGPKNFKLLADISFESSLQNTVLPSLLLFLCACY